MSKYYIIPVEVIEKLRTQSLDFLHEDFEAVDFSEAAIQDKASASFRDNEDTEYVNGSDYEFGYKQALKDVRDGE